VPSTTNAWAAVDDAVLRAFRDGRPRTASDVYRMLPDLTHREVCHALDANAQKGHLAAGESTYQTTEAGKRHLANTMEVA
jgi:hypothetical protein